jgi:predicted ArsR family transcriptional regulator
VENTRVPKADARQGYGPLPTARVRLQRTHLSAARAGILEVLVDQPEPCTVGALSALTHQHPNTIREHLEGLVGDRLAARVRAPASGRGRPAWLYSATLDVGSDPGASDYAGLASALAAQIARTSKQPRADAIEAGRAWGRDLVRRTPVRMGEGKGPVHDPPTAPSAVSARRQVVSLLEELGFAPSPDARAAVVKLRRCPLLEAAHQSPDVVCGVHLGIVRGVLDELGNDSEQTERTALHAFWEPGACRLDLLPRSAANQ